VVAVTAPVAIDGRVRAYIELELSTAALGRVLSTNRDSAVALQVMLAGGTGVTSAGPRFPALSAAPATGIVTTHRWRYTAREVPEAPGWYVVAAAEPPSTFQLAVQPTQAAILGLAVLMLAMAWLASVGTGRSRPRISPPSNWPGPRPNGAPGRTP